MNPTSWAVVAVLFRQRRDSANRLFDQRLLLEMDRQAYIDAAAQSSIGK